MRSLFFVLLLLAVLVVASVPTTVHADGPVLSTDPKGTTTQEFDFQMPADARPGQFLLYLRNPLTTTLEISFIQAYVHGADAALLPAATISFTLAEADEPLRALTLDAESARAVLMHVRPLPASGAYTGVISVQPSGAAPTYASLKLNSPANTVPAFKLVQADANKKIAFAAGTPEFEFPLTLVQETATTASTPVTLTVTPLTRQDASDAVPVPVMFRNAAAGAVDAERLPLQLVPNEPQTIWLTGTLPRRAAYAGNLVVHYGAQVDTYALVVNPGTDSIALREFADGKIIFSSGSAIFTRPLTLEVSEGAPTFSITSISTSPLLRQDGQPVVNAKLECKNCDTPRELGPGAPLTIALAANGLEATTYVATLNIGTQGYSKSFPLILARTGLRENLGLTEPGTIAGTSWLPLFLPATIDVGVTVSETMNTGAEIFYPRIDPALELTDKDGKSVSVSPAQMQLYERDTNGALRVITDTQATTHLDGNARRAFVLRIGGLGNGSYKANVNVGGPDSKTIVRTATINIKDSPIVPLFVLALGVFLAYGLYHWTQVGRPQALRAAAIAERKEYVARQLASAKEDSVWQELLPRLDYLAARNLTEDDKGTTIQSDFEELKERVRLYDNVQIATHNADAALADHPETPADAQTAREKFRQEKNHLLERAQQVVTGAGAENLKLAQAEEQTKSLEQLAVRVRASALSWLPKTLLQMLNSLTDVTDDTSAKLKTQQAELGTELEAIVQALNTVAASTSKEANQDLQALRNRVETALQRFAAFYGDYLRGKILVVRNEIAQRQDLDWRDTSTQLTAAENALNQLRADETADAMLLHLNQANTAYAAAWKTYDAVRPKIRGESKEGASVLRVATEFNAADMRNPQIGFALPLLSKPDSNSSASDWLKFIQRSDWWVLVIGLGVSVLTGLLAQYASPATFGTLQDYVNAFLWGFSITAGTGFVAIAQKFKFLPAS